MGEHPNTARSAGVTPDHFNEGSASMEDRTFYNDEGYELLDAETSRMVDELTDGIEDVPYPNQERGEDEYMINHSALQGNAEAIAENYGHFLEWKSSQLGICLSCGASGTLSLDPMITQESEVGTFYHGFLFNGRCGEDV